MFAADIDALSSCQRQSLLRSRHTSGSDGRDNCGRPSPSPDRRCVPQTSGSKPKVSPAASPSVHPAQGSRPLYNVVKVSANLTKFDKLRHTIMNTATGVSSNATKPNQTKSDIVAPVNECLPLTIRVGAGSARARTDVGQGTRATSPHAVSQLTLSVSTGGVGSCVRLSRNSSEGDISLSKRKSLFEVERC